MKTKTRTFIVIALLGVIGITNIHATADYKKLSGEMLNIETESTLTIEGWMTNDDYWTPKTTNEVVEAEQSLRLESWMTNENLWK